MPGASIECDDGTIVVTEPLAGRVLRLSGDRRDILAEGLGLSAALADAGDGSVYLSESATGRLLRISLRDGKVSFVAEGLGTIRAIATTPDGLVAVLDGVGGRLLLVEPTTGATTLVAQHLAVGQLQEPYARSGGLAVGSDGSIYVAADAENAVYRILPQTLTADRKDACTSMDSGCFLDGCQLRGDNNSNADSLWG